MKESFQEEHLQTEISCIETTKPTLSLFEEFPACNGIGEWLDVVVGLNMEWMQRRQGYRAVLNVA